MKNSLPVFLVTIFLTFNVFAQSEIPDPKKYAITKAIDSATYSIDQCKLCPVKFIVNTSLTRLSGEKVEAIKTIVLDSISRYTVVTTNPADSTDRKIIDFYFQKNTVVKIYIHFAIKEDLWIKYYYEKNEFLTQVSGGLRVDNKDSGKEYFEFAGKLRNEN